MSRTYTHIIKCSGLSVRVPDDWQDASQLVAVGPVVGGFRPNVVVTSEPVAAGTTASALAAQHLTALRSAVSRLTVDGEEPVTLAGKPGVLRRQSFVAEGFELTQLVGFVVIGSLGYVVTAAHLKKEFSGSAAALRAAVTSFTLV